MAPSHTLVAQGIQRRKDIMAFIRNFRREHGFSPTSQEIATGVGFSTKSSVRRHLDILIAEGKLTEVPNTYRSIRPTVRHRVKV